MLFKGSNALLPDDLWPMIGSSKSTQAVQHHQNWYRLATSSLLSYLGATKNGIHQIKPKWSTPLQHINSILVPQQDIHVLIVMLMHFWMCMTMNAIAVVMQMHTRKSVGQEPMTLSVFQFLLK